MSKASLAQSSEMVISLCGVICLPIEGRFAPKATLEVRQLKSEITLAELLKHGLKSFPVSIS